MNRREPRPISGVRYKDSVKGKWARGDAGLRPSASLWVSLVRCALPLIAASLLTACGSDPHLSFLDPQGPVADAQRWHFYEVLGVMTVLVAGPIFLLLPFFAWRYRYGNKTRKYTPKWEYSRLLEIMSWTGPIIIVAILAFFVWRDSHRLDPYKVLVSDQAPLRIQVIASIGMLAVPAGRPFSMRLTSATVMQSLFIPALGSQIYSMGGMVTQLNLQASQPGRFLGENTMYNGDGFHQQNFTTVAMTTADFEGWVKDVRTNGIPLDVIAAFPAAKSMHGNLYLTDVSKSLFPAVVKATMDGEPSLPEKAFEHAGVTQPDAQDLAGSKAETP